MQISEFYITSKIKELTRRFFLTNTGNALHKITVHVGFANFVPISQSLVVVDKRNNVVKSKDA